MTDPTQPNYTIASTASATEFTSDPSPPSPQPKVSKNLSTCDHHAAPEPPSRALGNSHAESTAYALICLSSGKTPHQVITHTFCYISTHSSISTGQNFSANHTFACILWALNTMILERWAYRG